MRTNYLLPWYVSLELTLHDYACRRENVLQRGQLLQLLLWLFGSDEVLGGGMLGTWWWCYGGISDSEEERKIAGDR